MLEYILIITGLDAVIARRDEEGASAVEYGLLVAGIAALVVAIVFLFGGMISERLHRHLRRRSADGAGTGATCALIGSARPGGARTELHRVLRVLARHPARAHLGGHRMFTKVHRALRESHSSEDGASAVEYGLLIAGVAALIVAIVFLFGERCCDLFENTCDSVGTGSGGSMSCAETPRSSPQTPALPRAQGCRAAPQRARVSIAPAHRGW